MFDRKKGVFAALGVLVAAVVFLLPPPESLEIMAQAAGYSGQTAMIVLAAVFWAVFWWIGDVLPDWCTALWLNCIWIVAADVPFQQAFSAFAKETVWLIIGAFSLGAAVVKTGILRRIALGLMHLFPATFRGQVAALITTGLACGPLMPSSTAKVVLGSKIATSVSELMHFEPHSSGHNGLFIASWTGFGILAPTFLSASFLSYTMLDALPAEYKAVSWMEWLISMLPWCLIMTAAMYATIMVKYRPASMSEKAEKQALEVTKMSKQETVTLVILGVCLVLWMLEKKIGVGASIVAVAGGVCCFAFGILSKKDVATAVPWSFVLFVGVVNNMGEVLSKVGISNWMVSFVAPVLESCPVPVLLLPIIFLITVAMRFLIASQTAVIVLVTSLLAPIGIQMGISPYVLGLACYSAISTWPALYQNPTYRAALEGTDGTVYHKDTLSAAIVYLAAGLLATIVCIPYWAMLGYISL